MFVIGQKAAQEIVNEISKITQKHTNLMDDKGEIIASTDPARIGQLHDGAFRVLNERLDELYISEESQSQTVRTGINLPIIVNKIPRGVIGITGDYKDVMPHAKLAQRITEILIGEAIRQEDIQQRHFLLQDFLHYWILGDGLSEGDRFTNRGLALGIDTQIPRRLALIQIQVESPKENQLWKAESENIRQEIRTFCEKRFPVLILYNDINSILLMQAYPSEHIRRHMLDLREHIQERFCLTSYIGIDSLENGTNAVNVSYIQAKKAVQAAELSRKPVLFYNDITIESFLNCISKSDKLHYIHRLFPGQDDATIRKDLRLIDAWFAHNGSISRAADELFMHKNSFQYQIKKLARLSGLDIRKPVESVALYLALLFYRELRGSSFR